MVSGKALPATPKRVDANYVDARGSHFNDIRGDQIIHSHHYHILDPDHIPDQCSDKIHHTTPSHILSPEDLTPQQPVVNLSWLNDNLQLITKIISLIDLDKTSCAYRTLMAELELLEHTLRLTGLGIKAYHGTQIGRSLAKTIKPELMQCHGILQKLLDEINTYRQTLWYTPIRSFWTLVLRWWGEEDELAARCKELSDRRSSLGIFVMALHSVAWTPLGNELLMGHVALRDFRTLVKHGPHSLRDIRICKVLVMDHLGDNIPVPTMFCSSWRSFHEVIISYCKNRPGYRYVAREDYRVIRANDKDGLLIGPSEFGRVRLGKHLEMSIVLRQRTSSQVNEGRCPRCHHKNPTDTATAAGWIDYVCDAYFNVMQADTDDRRSDKGAQTNSSRHPGRGDVVDENVRTGEDNVEQVISPMSGLEETNAKAIPSYKTTSQRPEDETRHFLRFSTLVLPDNQYRLFIVPGVLNIDHYRLVNHSGNADIFEIQNSNGSFLIRHFRFNADNRTQEAILFRKLSELQNRLASQPLQHNISTFEVARTTIRGVPTHVMAMPFFMNGSILDQIQYYEDFDMLLWVKQFAVGLAILHNNGVVHSNIYPGNILITPGRGVCITDPGVHAIYFRTLLDATGRLFVPNSWPYKSREELFRGVPEDGSPVLDFTKDMDVYGFASTVYFMYRGSAPFSLYSQHAIEIRQYGHTRLAKPIRMNDALWRILQQCWSLFPAERPTMDVVFTKLNEIELPK